MKFAYTLAPGRGETNLLLAELAERLTRRGLRLCGSVQIDTEREKRHHCDMDLRILPDGPVIRISQDLGPAATACRLDTDALERAVALTGQMLETGADAMILNKFGKHEAEGRGYRDTIAAALSKDVPVLVGANKLNLAALREFAGGEIEELPADLSRLVSWVTG
jgi:nucleoside-triphosphatase THEP1